MKKNRLFLICALCLALTACGESPSGNAANEWSLPDKTGARDNAIRCLIPVMDGITVYGNELAELDCSHLSQGYLFARYLGDNPKVRLQIQKEDDKKYTYVLQSDGTPDVFPLSAGDGVYTVSIFENLQQSQYSLAFSAEITVALDSPYLPFLYPNQYVRFDEDSLAVRKGQELAAPADTDLDVVSNVYNYIIQNVRYDVEEAETVESGYLPDVDEVLLSGKGICLDYAALMCAMLRSQQIPARMEIGYAGTAYHAWISVYIEGIGWINGMIEFDGEHWSLMDPTFAASNGDDYLKDFIGDGDNYTLKFTY